MLYGAKWLDQSLYMCYSIAPNASNVRLIISQNNITIQRKLTCNDVFCTLEQILKGREDNEKRINLWL